MSNQNLFLWYFVSSLISQIENSTLQVNNLHIKKAISISLDSLYFRWIFFTVDGFDNLPNGFISRLYTNTIENKFHNLCKNLEIAIFCI